MANVKSAQNRNERERVLLHAKEKMHVHTNVAEKKGCEDKYKMLLAPCTNEHTQHTES